MVLWSGTLYQFLGILPSKRGAPVGDELQPGEGKARDALRLQLLQHVRHHGDQRQAGGVSLRVGREGGRQLSDEPQEDAVVGAPVQRLPAHGRVPHQHPRHHPQHLVQQAEAAAVRCSDRCRSVSGSCVCVAHALYLQPVQAVQAALLR